MLTPTTCIATSNATIVAFIVGYATIHWLMNYLRTRPTYVFIVYRLILGAAIIGMLLGALGGRIARGMRERAGEEPPPPRELASR